MLKNDYVDFDQTLQTIVRTIINPAAIILICVYLLSIPKVYFSIQRLYTRTEPPTNLDGTGRNRSLEEISLDVFARQHSLCLFNRFSSEKHNYPTVRLSHTDIQPPISDASYCLLHAHLEGPTVHHTKNVQVLE